MKKSNNLLFCSALFLKFKQIPQKMFCALCGLSSRPLREIFLASPRKVAIERSLIKSSNSSRMRTTLTKFFSLLFFIILSACGNKMELDENAVPKTLIIGIFVEEGPEASMERYGPIGKYLEKKLGMKVEYTLTTDYTAVIEAIRAKKIHVAYLPPFSYVLAKKKTGIDVMVTTGIDGKPYHYKSAIITGKNSGIKSLDDV